MKEELEINPEFEKIIPDLSEDEFMQLEENILSEGMISSEMRSESSKSLCNSFS